MLKHGLTLLRILLLAPLTYLLARGGNFHQWAALVVFVAVGVAWALDVLRARRSGGDTPFGAILQVMAARLLTVSVMAGLIAVGGRGELVLIAGLTLIARDIVVAALAEALPGKLDLANGGLERAQLALQFLGFGFLVAPSIVLPETFLQSHIVGALALVGSAVLAVAALFDYGRQAARGFRA